MIPLRFLAEKTSNLNKGNLGLFSQQIAKDARDGAKLCKIGAILDITVILMFIGNILRVIGYFKLASLNDLDDASL